MDKTNDKKTSKVNRKDNIQISFRVDAKTYDKLKQSADTFNYSVTKYVKTTMIKSKLKTPKFSPENQLEFLKQLRGTTANLNQLTKQINQRKTDLKDNEKRYIVSKIDELKSEVDRLWQLLN